MPGSQRLKDILAKAKEEEKKYDWVKAADLYEQVLGVVRKKDFFRKGEIQERIGHCFHRAAFQAETKEEFKDRMRRAVEEYEKAHDFFEKLVDEQKAATMFRCKAVAKYLGYWLTSDPSEKRRLLDECLELEAKALEAFSKSGNMLDYCELYNELPLVFDLRVELESDGETRKSILERGIEWGEKAVATLPKPTNHQKKLAKSYCTLSRCLMGVLPFIADLEQQEENRLKACEYLSKAIEILEKTGEANFLGWSHGLYTDCVGPQGFEEHTSKALECGKQTRDNLLTAIALLSFAYITKWQAETEEDLGKWKSLARKALQFYDTARHHSSMISYLPPGGGPMVHPAAHAEYYLDMAKRDLDTEKRLEFVEKAAKIAVKALETAESSGKPDAISICNTWVSVALTDLAKLQSDVTKKRDLLKKAVQHKKTTIRFREELIPYHYWNNGVGLTTLAYKQAELANVEPNVEDKQRLLEEASSNMEKGFELMNTAMPVFEKMGYPVLHRVLGRDQNRYATLLTQHYGLTKNPAYLRRAIAISRKAIKSAEKLDLASLMAESQWKIAKTQDILGEHWKSAESFKLASKHYFEASEKIPQLKKFYQDHAVYMQAWIEIEKARHHHRRQEYDSAKEHFEKAANIHKSLRKWNYLTPNYIAWAKVEKAEGLSRQEQSEGAIKAFEHAARLFEETKKSLQSQLGKIENPGEKQMVTNLIKATDLRREYCTGRVGLEEARMLDKKGDHYSSSEKYGSAAKTFEKIARKIESEQDRKEFKLIITLSHAWRKMTRAETEASPTLYREASQLFEEAKGLISNEKAKMLALGHSRFCKALEAGTRFENTRDTTIYLTAKKHIEAATNYYLKAGFKTASEYAKATYRLFDAYMFTHKAQTETGPGKKARFYQMAEKLLQASAGSYMKAKHPEKSEEVQRLLESVKEERELATSLAEVLHAPLISSTTASFSAPNPIYEKAVGLERFEHAHIQANLFIQPEEVKVGENVALEIELVNAGKGPATLVKVEDIVPAGFNIIEKPEIYRAEDSYLNMRGKRLDPLKTEDVKIIVKPLSKGVSIMKPRILYLDETGKCKSHEPEPVTITVRELGISGWIKGER